MHEPMKTASTAMSSIASPPCQPHVLEGAADAVAVGRVVDVVGRRHAAGDRGDHARVGAPGDLGGERRRHPRPPRGRRRRPVAGAARASDSTAAARSARARRAAPRTRRRWCRRARSCRRARRPRSTCCRPSCGPPSSSARIAEPAYSMTWPARAGHAERADRAEDEVLGADAHARPRPRCSSASCAAWTGSGSGSRGRARPRWCRCRTRGAPKAPCVEVWLSPQTMVMPGWVTPSSGPIDVDDALARCCAARTAGCRTRRSCARAPRSGPPRAGRRCRPRGRSWARCG